MPACCDILGSKYQLDFGVQSVETIKGGLYQAEAIAELRAGCSVMIRYVFSLNV